MEKKKRGQPSRRGLIIGLATLGVVAILFLTFWLGSQSGRFPWQSADLNPTTIPRLTPTSNPTNSDFRSIPAPTATLQPNNEPGRLLSLADRMLQNGQFSDAATQYNLILNGNPGSPEAANARFGLARAEAGRNRAKEAIAAYQQFLTDYPKEERRRLAIFGLAEAQMSLGQYEQAIANYQKYRQEFKEQAKFIEGYLQFSIAAAYMAAGKSSEAIDSYNQVATLKDGGSALLQAQALERIGDFYVAQNRPLEAIPAYNRILGFAKVTSYRADVAFKVASAYDKAGQTAQTGPAYQAVVDQYFGTAAANRALQILIDANNPTIDDYLRGYNAYRKSQYNEAVNILDKFIGRPGPGLPVPPLSTTVPAEKVGRAWLWEAISIESLDVSERAISEYREIISRLPKTAAAEEANWRLAELLRDQNKLLDASNEYANLVNRYPNSGYAEDALFSQFQLVLQKDGPEQADKLARTLFDNYGRGYEALFKLAQGYEAAGRPELVRPLYQKLATRNADNYYSVRAVEIMAGITPVPPIASKPETHSAVYDSQRLAADFEPQKKELEGWLNGWAVKTIPTNTSPQTPAYTLDTATKIVQDDSGMSRFLELTRLGRSSQAEREAMELVGRYAGKPFELYYLSLTFSQQRQYYYSIQAARDLFALYQRQNPLAGLLTAPELLQRLIYPLYYLDIVQDQVRRYNIDPLLMLSLVKQESAFDPLAQSGADALGLTQVIPSTGKGIATSLGKTDFQPQDLFRPYTAIEFGTYYLGQQIKNFEGDPYAALAAYNSGAGNLDEWLKANPPEKNFDRFVDGITFSETRLYVKIIYSNYYLYRQIYRD